MAATKKPLIAFFVFLVVFIATHVVEYPGSLSYLMEFTQGQKILDMKPSTSADETYQRLEAFSETGRRLYLRTMLTVDIVFPLSAFFFLFTLAGFVSTKLRLKSPVERSILILPIAYLVLDFVENMAIATMLLRFPERLELAGAFIGFITRAKRFSMLGALILPIVLLGAASWRKGLLNQKVRSAPSLGPK